MLSSRAVNEGNEGQGRSPWRTTPAGRDGPFAKHADSSRWPTWRMQRRTAVGLGLELSVPAIKSRSRAAAVGSVGPVPHRPRHQRCQPLHELQRAHDQVRGSVAPRRLEFELHLAGGIELHPAARGAQVPAAAHRCAPPPDPARASALQAGGATPLVPLMAHKAAQHAALQVGRAAVGQVLHLLVVPALRAEHIDDLE